MTTAKEAWATARLMMSEMEGVGTYRNRETGQKVWAYDLLNGRWSVLAKGGDGYPRQFELLNARFHAQYRKTIFGF